MTEVNNSRASIFDDDNDLDLSAFTPKPKASQSQPDKATIRKVAEARGFSSREPEAAPAPVQAAQEPLLQRRYRTGRNRQLNLKVTDDALRSFYALADAQGLVLGEVFEQAVMALEAAIARGETPLRPGKR
jgi:hypothetical protein